MTFRYLYTLLALLTLVASSSCKRDDDEPIVNRDISRLYISYSEFERDPQRPKLKNLYVITAADSIELGAGAFAQGYQSNVQGGSTILFHPSARTIFQASLNTTQADTTIYSLRVGDYGALSPSGNIANARLNGVRGLVYHPSLDKLYAVRVSPDSSFVYVFNLPRGIRNYAKTSQNFQIADNRPVWDAAIVQSKMYLSRTEKDGGIDIYNNMVIQRDTLVPNVKPDIVLTIPGSENIRGMSIDTVNNMLAVADFTGTGASSVGRILIFDNFSEIAKSTGNITPTRIITGASTGLKQPVDVDLDFRKDSDYLFVADAVSKKVYRFKKTDTGDVKPDKEFVSPGNYTPISLSLDARQ
ncbi:hypothetical protein ACS126_07100 [Sphingobacterium lactis]|uniref:hypothetical protein n=1 Tax=Sphingobacterium lactis TaxID=797291 RepID=UPI003EC6CB25